MRQRPVSLAAPGPVDPVAQALVEALSRAPGGGLEWDEAALEALAADLAARTGEPLLEAIDALLELGHALEVEAGAPAVASRLLALLDDPAVPGGVRCAARAAGRGPGPAPRPERPAPIALSIRAPRRV